MPFPSGSGLIGIMKHSIFFSIVIFRNMLLQIKVGSYSNILGKMLIVNIFLLAIFIAGESEAATCVTGSCHSDLTKTKYLHGPVAAELAGGKGCVACHVPAGKACSKGSKGVFKILAPASLVCQICHARGTGTQHSIQKIDCLKCHDPHGSNKNTALNR